MSEVTKTQAILVVGGAGYIGSHTAKLLLKRGYRPVILDDLSTGYREAADRATQGGPFYEGSYDNFELVAKILKQHQIETVMHFGAKALVGESVTNPLLYYDANVGGTIQLIKAMLSAGAKNFIFSSTCATFGQPGDAPIHENLPQNPINPYGQSKLFVEKILKDLHGAHGIRSGILRYFNAAGADPDCELGEAHNPETHLIPLALKAALTQDAKRQLTVFGNDYPTRDGSCIRDYIHINDLGEAHIKVMELILKQASSVDFNLGSEKGYSVLEVIAMIEKVTGMKTPHTIGKRRAGDPPILVANSTKAHEVLKWKPQHDLESIISTAFQWMKKMPNGFEKK